MHATADATGRYAARFPGYLDRSFYRDVRGMQVSSLGIGTYLGGADDATDRAYTDALIAAGEGGINFFDCAINYRHQRSERSVGAALIHLNRDEIVVATKAGFLTPGAVPEMLPPGDVVGRMHSMAPGFSGRPDRAQPGQPGGRHHRRVLPAQSRDAAPAPHARTVRRRPFARAFARLEQLADRGWIRWYGAATWDGLRQKNGLSLRRLADIAAEEGGREHRFRFIQLPFNLGMVEALSNQVLETAAELDITVVASATLLQTRVLQHMPDAARDLLPGLETDAQRAIQFTRSTPGIAVALVGMSRREHVADNLGVARVPPLSREEYSRLYR